jgi:hypothetical protein
MKALEGFLQNWLYFGLLHEVFGDDIDLADFVKENDDGAKVITTAPLVEAFIRWVARLEGIASSVEDEEAKKAVGPLWAMLNHYRSN